MALPINQKLFLDGTAREILETAVKNKDAGIVYHDALTYRLTVDLTESINRASESSNKVQWALVLVGTGMWAYLGFEIVKLLFLNP
jgi:hypothetical protein